MLKGILWSGIARNNIILAEAGEDFHDGAVINTAQKLLKKKATPGWEYARSRRDGLRGFKFHVFDESNIITDDMIVWSFIAIAETSLEEDQVKSYLEKLVYITDVMRSENDDWRNGEMLAAQETFAPILLDKMEQVSHQGRLAMVNDSVSSTRELMAENIEMALERSGKLEELDNEAKDLSAMSKVFKTRAKDIKRFSMWQNAKHGLLIGTAITAGVAVVTVPPLVAIL